MAGDWCLECGKKYLTVITDTHVIKWCRECRTRIEDEWVGGAPVERVPFVVKPVTDDVNQDGGGE